MALEDIAFLGPTTVGGEHGRVDYGSGPHMALVAAAVRLARQDLSHPRYSDEARVWLRTSPLVELFAECIGYGGSFE